MSRASLPTFALAACCLLYVQCGARLLANAPLTPRNAAASHWWAIEPDDAVESGREILGSPDYPWYDRAKDDVRLLPLRSESEAGEEFEGTTEEEEWSDEDWERFERNFDERGGASGRGGSGSGRGGSGGGSRAGGRQAGRSRTASQPISFSGGGEFLQVLAWIMIGVLILIVVILLVRYFINREKKSKTNGGTNSAIEDEDKLDELPFDLKTPTDSLLEEARRLYEAGNFNQAIIYYYSYQLVQMDRRQMIQLAKGKTNRQYLREIGRRPPLRSLVERSVFAFERVFFGKHSLDKAAFEEVWTQQGSFEQMLQGTAA